MGTTFRERSDVDSVDNLTMLSTGSLTVPSRTQPFQSGHLHTAKLLIVMIMKQRVLSY